MQRLFIFCGIPFAGKSELAKIVVSALNYVRVDLDEVKNELLGEDIRDEMIASSDWDRIYQEMYTQIDTLLRQGKTVIHDTGNFAHHERNLVRQIGERNGVETITVYVDTPTEVARQRMLSNRIHQSRFDVSDESFESAVSEMEPPQPGETCITFDGSIPIDSWIRMNFT